MVRVNHSSVTVDAVGCASFRVLSLRNVTTRGARAEDDARSRMDWMAKSRLRFRWLYDDTWMHHVIAISPSELLNELPVRIREEVERIRDCCRLLCFVETYNDGRGGSDIDNNLHRHQLFSDDHAENMDPEIRQWLPRIVCPGYPFSNWCDGGVQLGDAMWRHIEICKGFKNCFPGEHRNLSPQSRDSRPGLDEKCQVLKMTFGQLESLTAQFLRKQQKLADVSPEALEAILHSWRPIVKPGVEAVPLTEFPPFRMPSCFGPANHDLAGLGRAFLDYARSNTTSHSTPVPSEDMQDAPQSGYPELYLPPELLHPMSDPAYVAAAVAAHLPRTEEASPLLGVPFPSFLAEIPRTCFEDAELMDAYDFLPVDTRGKGFHVQIQEMATQ
ncbi:hypothetical protein BC827DRAFT_69571 [Russula dissimulans]|nr:hypothetical protein BC827DRAFT_69571 [Russula dissimulans]